MEKEHVVYALVHQKECVYVGCTTDLKNRLKHHNQHKIFDDKIIISRHSNKKDALLAERSIIKFLSIFGGRNLYNGKYILLAYQAQVEMEIDVTKNHY